MLTSRISSRRLAGLVMFMSILISVGVARATAADVTLVFVARTTDLTEIEGRGGFARLAGVLKSERARGPVLFIHGGDTLSQGALAAYDQGAHQIDLLNALDLDAFGVQPREFNHGEDVLAQRAAEAEFPMIASNVRDSDGGANPDGLEEELILTAGPLKVGLMSIIGSDDLIRSAARRTRTLDPLEAARARAASLRATGADIVVAMTSDRRGIDLELRASGIADIVLSAERTDMRAGVLVDEGGTLFAAPASNARWAVALDISAAPAGPRQDGSRGWHAVGRVIDTALHPPDPDMARRVGAYMDRLAAQQGTPVLTLAAAVDTRMDAVRLTENGFANLIADTVRTAMGADAVLLNAGVIRGYRVYAPGHVLTRGELLSELPFRNRVLLLDLTGEQLRTALEHAVFDAENRGGGAPDGRFPVISNLRISADTTRPPGGRLTAVMVGGRPLDPLARYRVATTDYLANGGDEFTILASAPRLVGEAEADQLSTIVTAAWTRMGTATPTTDGRIDLRHHAGRR